MKIVDVVFAFQEGFLQTVAQDSGPLENGCIDISLLM